MAAMKHLAEIRRHVTAYLLSTHNTHSTYKAKRVLESLLDDPLDYNKISNLCFEGTIRTTGLRALYWKIVLRYLPLDISQWDAHLKQKRDAYFNYRDDFIVKHDLTKKFQRFNEIANRPRSRRELSRVNRMSKQVLRERENDNDRSFDCVDVITGSVVGLTNRDNSRSSYDNNVMPIRKEVDGEVCSSFTHSVNDEGHINCGLNEAQNYDCHSVSTHGEVKGKEAAEGCVGCTFGSVRCSEEAFSDMGENLVDAVGNTTGPSGEEMKDTRIENNGEAQHGHDLKSCGRNPSNNGLCAFVTERQLGQTVDNVSDCDNSVKSGNGITNVSDVGEFRTLTTTDGNNDNEDAYGEAWINGECLHLPDVFSDESKTPTMRQVSSEHPLLRDEIGNEMVDDDSLPNTKDAEVFDQINKDLFRTRPETKLLSQTLFAAGDESLGTRNMELADMVNPTRHCDIFCRILYLYSKMNPTVGYVQGMNEILAPIYYCFFTDPTCSRNLIQTEADVFYCFSELMQLQNQQECFCNLLDDSDVGIMGRLLRFASLLKLKEPEVYRHLISLGIEVQFFALRWLLLLLCQEFSLPDTLRLWDTFISDPGHPLPIFYYVCVVIVRRLRLRVLSGDFCKCMNLLQKFPSYNVVNLLTEAVNLRRGDIARGILPYRDGQLVIRPSKFGTATNPDQEGPKKRGRHTDIVALLREGSPPLGPCEMANSPASDDLIVSDISDMRTNAEKQGRNFFDKMSRNFQNVTSAFQRVHLEPGATGKRDNGSELQDLTPDFPPSAAQRSNRKVSSHSQDNVQGLLNLRRHNQGNDQSICPRSRAVHDYDFDKEGKNWKAMNGYDLKSLSEDNSRSTSDANLPVDNFVNDAQSLVRSVKDFCAGVAASEGVEDFTSQLKNASGYARSGAKAIRNLF